MMINANNNACFETPVTAVTFSTEKLLFINNPPIPLEKDLCKQPPTPSVIDSFSTSPPPLGISVALRGGVMDIFCNYTLHLPKGGRRVKKEF